MGRIYRKRYLTVAILAMIVVFSATIQSRVITMNPLGQETTQIPPKQPPELDGYVYTSKNIVGFGYAVNITVFVENQGETEQIFDLTTYYNSIPFRTDTLTLAAGSNTTVRFSWAPSSEDAGEYTIWASITDGNLSTPDRYTGSQLFVSIPGDMNRDGEVNILDIAAIAKLYGLGVGDPDYDSNMDINGDSAINIMDIATAAKNYGKSWDIPRNIVSISATSPHVADGEDASIVTVTVEDEHGSPVAGANLVVFAEAGKDWKDVYLVDEMGHGAYGTQMVAACSGNYTLVAVDRFGNSNNTIVAFVPGPTTNVYLASDYDAVGNLAIIEAFATDACGNVVKDVDLTFTTDLGTITSIQEDSLGLYTVTLTPDDWGVAIITATDAKSGISNTTQVEFSGAHLDVLKYPQLHQNFTIATYTYAPAKHGYLNFYSMKIFFNSTATTLLEVTDGDPTDGFPSPNVDMIDADTIMIYQENELKTAVENICVANLTFNAATPGPFTIGILPPEMYLKTIREGIPYTWFLQAPPPIKVKTGTVVEITIKIWRLLDRNGNPIVSDDNIKKDVAKLQKILDDHWEKCLLKDLILKIRIEIVDISYGEWKLIDDCDDVLELWKEFKDLLRDFNARLWDAKVNAYYGFDLGCDDGWSWAPGDEDPAPGGGLFRGGIFIDHAKDETASPPDITLAHELIHYLSKNQITDSYDETVPIAERRKQGALNPKNMYNGNDYGDRLSKWQCEELVRKLLKYADP